MKLFNPAAALFIFLLFLPLSGYSQVNLTYNGTTNDDIEVFAGDDSVSSNQIRLVVDPASDGKGETEADPLVVYMPLRTDQTSTSTDQSNSFINLREENNSNSTNLPSVVSQSTINIHFRLNVVGTNTSADTYYVSLAVKDDNGEYRHVQTVDIELGTPEGQAVLFPFDFSFCSDISGNCADLKDAVGDNEGEIMLYFHLSQTEPSTIATDDQEITTSDAGLFVKVEFTDNLPENNLRLDDLSVGDGRLFPTFSGGNLITEMSQGHKSIALIDADPGCDTNSGGDLVSDILNSSELRIHDYVEDGRITLKPLENNTAYFVGLFQVNKYQFASPVSNCVSGTPLPIEAFLEEQACYLISAGFQREHWVLNAYRSFRDSFLLTTGYGQAFTFLYYRTAPEAVSFIIERPWLARVIRTFSYVGLAIIPLVVFVSLLLGIRALRRA